jgi:hypothetical protein
MSNENRQGATRPEKFDATKTEVARAFMRTVDTGLWNLYARTQEQSPMSAQFVDASGPTPVMSEVQAGEYSPVYRSPGALAVDSTMRAQQGGQAMRQDDQEGYDLAA